MVERYLHLRIKQTDPGLSLKDSQIGLALYARKGQHIQIVCEIGAKAVNEVVLSIAYNPSFFQLLNDADKASIGSGSFTKEFVWTLQALRASPGAMELQIQATDQGGSPQRVQLGAVVENGNN